MFILLYTIQAGPNAECRRKVVRGDRLWVHYAATFYPSGRIFDSTLWDGAAMQMRLGINEVIPGVEMGLMGMCPGEIRRLIVPSNLGYGDESSELIPGMLNEEARRVRHTWLCEQKTTTTTTKIF